MAAIPTRYSPPEQLPQGMPNTPLSEAQLRSLSPAARAKLLKRKKMADSGNALADLAPASLLTQELGS